MQKELNLHKLKTSLNDNNNAIYFLEDICLNEFVGKKLSIKFLGEINCVACGTKTNKSYSQGYCFMCMRKLPECDICIVKPELCHYAQGTCRDSKWGEDHCMKTHIVYLSNTGDVKVGITRLKNVPSRWIDQGATQALPIYAVQNRLISGLVEMALKNHIADKTNWRKMLQGDSESTDLEAIRDDLMTKSQAEINNIKDKYGDNVLEPVEGNLVNIVYPVLEFPTKIKSFNLDKDSIVQGKLEGIKGQYLIFDTGVINIRKFSGYKCLIEA
ncbi:DUF2797 domain-containing protein [Pseudofrancisella aestuarii]|uniref:DUF2797 domain-containing protein n=1 Tax=Pseudofrancisella aestuarii TaxID=2670347 RepID=A0ABV9TDM6_9GAMM|nr:DUF2797 domain-containing protein [Pseudofrancisella aestuarii]